MGSVGYFKFTISPLPGPLSINQYWKPRINRYGKPEIYVPWKAKKIKKSLENEMFFLFGNMRWKNKSKVWVKLVVYLPNHRWDCHNFIKAILDIIEKAIGINDAWFAIDKCDFEIDKENPRIELEVWQDD